MMIFSDKNCVLCGADADSYLCTPCFNDLPQLPVNRCPICLWPVPTDEICGTCLNNPPAYTRTIAAMRYAFPVDALIQSLKYRANLALAPMLAQLLLTPLLASNTKPDMIMPMPLHPIRLRERGFNQAMEIGRFIAKRLNIPLFPDCCQRIKNTQPQAELPWKERQKNIRKAFDCTIDLTGKHIAIIDDVMTTGATLNELASVLHKQGAAEVSNWVVARALPEKKPIDPFSIQ